MSIQGSVNGILGSVGGAVGAAVNAKNAKARKEAAAAERMKDRQKKLADQKKKVDAKRAPRTGSKAWVAEQQTSLGGKAGEIFSPDVLRQIRAKYQDARKQPPKKVVKK